MHRSQRTRVAGAAGATAVGATLALAAPALAADPAQVRFLHAVPGAPAATLADDGTRLEASFGEVSDYARVPSGSQTFSVAPNGEASMASTTRELEPGARYTVAAVPVRDDVRLVALRDATSGRPASSTLLRVVHLAPELGSPDVSLGGETLAEDVPFEANSGYVEGAPGRTSLALEDGGDELLSEDVDLEEGRPLSVFVVGSRGQSVRAIAVRDAASEGTATRRASTSTSRRSYTVKRGESLWSIVRDELGADASDRAVGRELRRIWERNAARVPSGDPDVLVTGQRLTI